MAWIGQYILDGDGNPQPEPDTLKWGMWFEHSHLSPGKDNRIVRQDRIGKIFVSTVFLGIDDHAFRGDEPHAPVLWETMIFGGDNDQYQRRYSSREEAEAGHVTALMLVEPWTKDIAELNRMMALEPDWERKVQ
jgi:hypothetical protein